MDIKEFKESLEKQFGKKSELIVKDPKNIVYERFSTGSYHIDDVMGGGYVKGTVVEVYGEAGSGKTTLCIHAVKEFQEKYPNEPILWIDLENVFDPIYFQSIGFDLDSENFMLLKPKTGEDTWDIMINFAKSVKGGLLILDSVALILPEKEDESDAGTPSMAMAARLNSQGFRKLFPHLAKNKTTFIAINQVRQNIGGYGDPNVTTGGKCWAFYARTRIKSSTQKGSEGIWQKNKYKMIKCNYGKKDAVAETSIKYGEGIYKMKELLDISLEKGVILKKGSWFEYDGSSIAQGADSLLDLLKDNPELVEEIEKKVFENE